MDSKNPQVWAVGVKELWKVPEGRIEPGYVAHTLGHPLGSHIFGGGFIFGMENNIFDIGLVVGLDLPFLSTNISRYKTTNPWPHADQNINIKFDNNCNAILFFKKIFIILTNSSTENTEIIINR